MRDGATLSSLLHLAVFLLLLVGLPSFLRRDFSPPPVIPIEVVNISDLTRAPARKVKPQTDTPVKELKEKKPVPPQPTPVIEEKPKPEESIADKTPDLTLNDLLASIPEEKPKEKPQEQPKEKKKPKKKQAFKSLLNTIEKMEASSEGKSQPDQDITSTEDEAADEISDILSITEHDLIRRQLASCWNVPAGARDAKDLYVRIKVEMNPDATVRSAVVTESNGGGSFGKAAADSALRAVKNPKCNPLKLPLDRYNQWKTMIIRFDPKDIL